MSMKYRLMFESQVTVDAKLKIANKDEKMDLALLALERGCMVGPCFSGVLFDELIKDNTTIIVREMAQGLERLGKGGYFYLEVKHFFESKNVQQSLVKTNISDRTKLDDLFDPSN